MRCEGRKASNAPSWSTWAAGEPLSGGGRGGRGQVRIGDWRLEIGDRKLSGHPSVSIDAFDYRAAAEWEMAALNVLGNRLRAESWPDDPPIDLDETVTTLRS